MIKKTLKAISLQNPPEHKPNTWQIEDLTNWIKSRHMDCSNLFQISQHVAVLLLLATGRRIHDLTLLHISPNHCIIDSDAIIFWPVFGSKTDNATYRQSGWKLSKNIDKVFDLCYWIQQLINASDQRRKADRSLTNLFITTRGKVKAASRSVIAGWIRTLFKQADIRSSPGSLRAAVASDNWSRKNLNMDEVLSRGNWRSSNTFLKFYCKEIQPSNTNKNSSVANFFSVT